MLQRNESKYKRDPTSLKIERHCDSPLKDKLLFQKASVINACLKKRVDALEINCNIGYRVKCGQQHTQHKSTHTHTHSAIYFQRSPITANQPSTFVSTTSISLNSPQSGPKATFKTAQRIDKPIYSVNEIGISLVDKSLAQLSGPERLRVVKKSRFLSYPQQVIGHRDFSSFTQKLQLDSLLASERF